MPLELALVIADEPAPILAPQLSLDARSREGFGAYSRIHYPRSAAFVLDAPVAWKAGDRLRVSLSQNVFELAAFPLVAHRGQVSVSDNQAFTQQSADSASVILADADSAVSYLPQEGHSFVILVIFLNAQGRFDLMHERGGVEFVGR